MIVAPRTGVEMFGSVAQVVKALKAFADHYDPRSGSVMIASNKTTDVDADPFRRQRGEQQGAVQIPREGERRADRVNRVDRDPQCGRSRSEHYPSRVSLVCVKRLYTPVSRRPGRLVDER